MNTPEHLKTKRTKELFLSLFVLISISFFSAFVINSLKPQKDPPPAILKFPIPLQKSLPSDIQTFKGSIQPNELIVQLLGKLGTPYPTIIKLLKDVKPIYNLKHIRGGNNYEITFKDKKFQEFKYHIDRKCYLLVTRDQDHFKGTINKIRYSTKTTLIRGVIHSSLFESIKKIDEKPILSDHLASIFEYDVDFNRDLHYGDSYTILIEKKYIKNKFIKYGKILFCQLINKQKKISIIRYTNPNGKTAYYHPNGRSVKKMFLKCPLPFMRVSSRFGNRRHPILKFSTKHYGVDLLAKPGTKIRSTASGIIFKSGYDKNKGRFIIIRHPNQYFTHYYHLSKIQKGIFRGKRVMQGQIIGYVGSTGLSTGPHLHYGMKKRNRFINPLKFNAPFLPSVKKEFLNDLYSYKDELLKIINYNTPLKFHDLRTNSGIIKVAPNFF